MIILTTLKQKDLAAVSAQQLLKGHTLAPKSIDRFDLFEIKGDFNPEKLRHAVEDSYIFSNPNKHHLIIGSYSGFNNKQLFFHVKRKLPMNLTHKVDQLNQKISAGMVSKIFSSELWVFNYSVEQVTALSITDIINNLLISSPSNVAPFAHPLIHTVEGFSFEEFPTTFSNFVTT